MNAKRIELLFIRETFIKTMKFTDGKLRSCADWPELSFQISSNAKYLLETIIVREFKSKKSPYVRNRTFGHVRPAKIQISLCICTVWSESSPSAFCIAKGTKFLYADNEDWSVCANVQVDLSLPSWKHAYSNIQKISPPKTENIQIKKSGPSCSKRR